MKLYEFFGSVSYDENQDNKKQDDIMSKEEENDLADEIFWYIIDNDDLHKKYFMPIARQIKKSDNDQAHDWKLWKHMVLAGCKKYYEEHEVPGNPKEVFNKKFRIDLCKRLTEHYHDDIMNDEYNLGY